MADVPGVSNPDQHKALGTRACRDSVNRTHLLSGPLARAWPPRGATGAMAPPLALVSAERLSVCSEPQIMLPPPGAGCGMKRSPL